MRATAAAVVDKAKLPVGAPAPGVKAKAAPAPKRATKAPAASTAPKVAPKPVTPAKSAKPAKPAKPVKPSKSKLVRNSFALPMEEFALLTDLKIRAGKLAHPVKRSALIRAGIKSLVSLTDVMFLDALNAVPAIKSPRRKKSKKG